MLFKLSHFPSPLLSHGLACHVSDGSITMACAGLSSTVQLHWFPPVQEMRDQEWNSGFPLTSPRTLPERGAGGNSVDWLWAAKSHVLPALVA